MNLTGLHFLLTYRCTFECDHCFVWGSPWQKGVMTLAEIGEYLRQAKEAGSIRSIAFEGGEPFLFYPTLQAGIRQAAGMGFQVGVVTNAFWATSEADALAALEPLVGALNSLTFSSDLFHYGVPLSAQVKNAQAVAARLGIASSVISVAQPEAAALNVQGQLPPGESGIMYRGRAAGRLSERVPGHPWREFTSCPYEDLRDPGRVHLDSSGNLHLCQGIVPGNLWKSSLKEICAAYDPGQDPVVGPLLAGGPAGLVETYGLPHAETYADACHLCYAARSALRPRFPEILAPDSMYGVY